MNNDSNVVEFPFKNRKENLTRADILIYRFATVDNIENEITREREREKIILSMLDYCHFDLGLF